MPTIEITLAYQVNTIGQNNVTKHENKKGVSPTEDPKLV